MSGVLLESTDTMRQMAEHPFELGGLSILDKDAPNSKDPNTVGTSSKKLASSNVMTLPST